MFHQHFTLPEPEKLLGFFAYTTGIALYSTISFETGLVLKNSIYLDKTKDDREN